MVKVNVLIGPSEEPGTAYRILDSRRPFEFTRVPCVGEIVSLGHDGDDVAADYRVNIVHHAPLKPNGIDAEIYVERVSLSAVLKESRPNENRGAWKQGSRPEGDRR